MKQTKNNHVCAYCKHFEEPFGFFDQMNRCALTQNPVQSSSTCIKFEHSGQLDMFTDINDELDKEVEENGEFI